MVEALDPPAVEVKTHVVFVLQEEMQRYKHQIKTYEHNTAQMDQDLENLRHEVQAKEALIDEHKQAQLQLEQVSEAGSRGGGVICHSSR